MASTGLTILQTLAIILQSSCIAIAHLTSLLNSVLGTFPATQMMHCERANRLRTLYMPP